jgi:hypothetical protein
MDLPRRPGHGRTTLVAASTLQRFIFLEVGFQGVAIRESLKRCAQNLHAEALETTGGISMEIVLARRTTRNAVKQLRYRVQLDIEEEGRVVYFSEFLWERADSGGVDLAPMLGPKEETFRVGPARQVSSVLERQARLFSKRYGAQFDFRPVRNEIARACEVEGYSLRHLIPLE